MPAEIKIVVKLGGQIETIVQGVAGPSCKDLAPWLSSLGRTLVEKPTDDFFRPEDQVTNAWSGSGS